MAEVTMPTNKLVSDLICVAQGRVGKNDDERVMALLHAAQILLELERKANG
jgi:hypothetical protein